MTSEGTAADPASAAGARGGHDDRPPIELGVLVIDELSPPVRATLEAALDSVRELCARRFPSFRWEVPVVDRRGPPASERVDPGELLFEGIHERDRRYWDFALVITASDLISHYKPYALAVPSRSTGVGVVSLARVTGSSGRGGAAGESDVDRLEALLLHVLADLCGIPHTEDPNEFTFAPTELADLDRMREFSQATEARLTKELTEIADARLEELSDVAQSSRLGFYLRAAWHDRDDIASAIIEARPWELPFRLSRLTAAAAATTLVLTMTAEAWDLGLRQPTALLALGAVVAILVAGVFVLKRQKLLLRRSRRTFSEQIVITNVSIASVVLLGMAATWLVLWLLSVLVSWAMFDAALVASWAQSDASRISAGHYLAFATFVATAGTLLGALGASFEGHDLVRYVVFADEET